MLHRSSGCDCYVLMHKSNEQRDTWYSVTTPGASELFSQKFPNIKQYWKKFIKTYEGVYKYVCMCIHMVYINWHKALHL